MLADCDSVMTLWFRSGTLRAMRANHTLRHDVTHEQARAAIRTALEVYCRKFPQFDPKTSWLNENRAQTEFRFKRITFLAEVEVLPDRLEMGMDVPLMFWPLRNRALAMLESEINKWLARAKAGELRPSNTLK